MKTAIKLLESNTLSIQDISFHVGYSDIFTFSKAFKKYTGKSPSHWKKVNISEISMHWQRYSILSKLLNDMTWPAFVSDFFLEQEQKLFLANF